MSVEVFGSSLDAIYTVLSVEAVFSLAPEEVVDVIDKTDGIDLSAGNGDVSVPTLMPALAVRISSLTEAGITRDQLDGTFVTFNGQRWKIYNSEPRPTPAGEAAGELFVLVRKA